MESQFYERIALSKNKSAMLDKSAKAEPCDFMKPEEAIKDPFVLEFREFLNLKDEYSQFGHNGTPRVTLGKDPGAE